ncbi:hypothetical protein [Nocardia carnea]|uniref:Secreted protein n=1 Tax=Nocardia carnea TaxID=37328 RepID=A0ABW7U1U3_9NOCA|nr:hypothetical protein [Nocardia carnea]
MNQRLATGLGAVALSIVGTGLFVPQATAQPAPNLAPGVSCEGFTCTNDTDDVYRIEWDAFCSNPGTDEPRAVVSTRKWVFPHGEAFMDVQCPFGQVLGHGGRHHRARHDGEDLVQGFVVDAHYKAALVDNPAPGPTGSAG